MPPVDASAPAGLALGIGVLVVDLILIVWMLRERRGRASELSAPDRRYFVRQDFRRGLVAFILGCLGVALIFGSRMQPIIAGKPNRAFVQLWFGVVVMILVLTLLALFDWIANRLYARRRSLELLREGLTLIEQERRARQVERFGPSGENGVH